MALTVGDGCSDIHSVSPLCLWLMLGDILIEDLVSDSGATCRERANLLGDLKEWTHIYSSMLSSDFVV